MLLAKPVNVMLLTLRRCVRLVLAEKLIVRGTAAAYGADSYSAGQLAMPLGVIGGATYFINDRHPPTAADDD
jgi:hypothetical protein